MLASSELTNCVTGSRAVSLHTKHFQKRCYIEKKFSTIFKKANVTFLKRDTDLGTVYRYAYIPWPSIFQNELTVPSNNTKVVISELMYLILKNLFTLSVLESLVLPSLVSPWPRFFLCLEKNTRVY